MMVVLAHKLSSDSKKKSSPAYDFKFQIIMPFFNFLHPIIHIFIPNKIPPYMALDGKEC
jgi:hypothetical protein